MAGQDRGVTDSTGGSDSTGVAGMNHSRLM